MKEKIFTILNDSQIVCTIWDNVEKPIGVIQIIHGIYDNMKTYNRFARFMNKNGYIVFGIDRPKCNTHPTCPDMFDKAVKLQMKIMNYLIAQYKLPLFLFGFGYGGFITQSILQKTNTATAGVCLAGTGKYPRPLLFIAKIYAWICAKIFGPSAPANILNRLSVGKNRAKSTIKCTHGFYVALLRGIEKIRPETRYNTPILMISGANSTISMNSRFSRALYNAYRDNGITRLTLIIYPDLSDSMLMQVNFGEMARDILDFFNYTATTN